MIEQEVVQTKVVAQDDIRKYYLRTNHTMWVYWLTHILTFLWCRLFWRIEVIIDDDIAQKIRQGLPPFDKGVILAPKHRFNCDPWVIGVMAWNRFIPTFQLKHRAIWFMTKVELFRHRWLAWFLNAQGAYPVHRGQADISAFKHTLQLLTSGKVVMIFPEGTRHKHCIGNLSDGIGVIAQRAGTVVLPIMTKYLRRGFRTKVFIKVGRPMQFVNRLYECQSGKKAREQFLSGLCQSFHDLER